MLGLLTICAGRAAFDDDVEDELPPELNRDLMEMQKKGLVPSDVAYNRESDSDAGPSRDPGEQAPAIPAARTEPSVPSGNRAPAPAPAPAGSAAEVADLGTVGSRKRKAGAKWNSVAGIAGAVTKWNTDMIDIGNEVMKLLELQATAEAALKELDVHDGRPRGSEGAARHVVRAQRHREDRGQLRELALDLAGQR